MSGFGTSLPRTNAAACSQLAKADLASSSQHVRVRQRIAELEAEVDALRRQAAAMGAEPTADVPPWVLLGVKIDQCPHSAEGDMRAANEGSGFDPLLPFGNRFCCDAQQRSRATVWYNRARCRTADKEPRRSGARTSPGRKLMKMVPT
jgi:hypothetical protein